MKLKYKKSLLILTVLLILPMVLTLNIQAQNQDPIVKIGNITRIKGIRDNQLIGYGIVVGLAGTGDSNRSQATVQSVANMMGEFSINVTPDQIRSKNLAAVMLTADLKPFVHSGDRIDVTVSSMGDADSLQGGTLVMSPLKAANGQIYAVAQGPVSIGGFNVQSGGSSARKNHPTVGRIPNGALVEREIEFDLNKDHINLLLQNPNFKTADNIAKALNKKLEYDSIARASDAGTVRVDVPDEFEGRVVDFIAQVNNIDVRSNIEAKIVIDEKTGTIVLSHNVRISTVAVAHGNISVTIKTKEKVSQPPSFSEGETKKTEETEIEVSEEEGNIVMISNENTIEDLVSALNTIGATPRDIVSIIQKIKAAGALHAKLELI
ncbi:MAG TPA: flagellar basal body P-ring protein FlgI [Halanaerobiales bacterium]|nr:flagellar basal body P-ring protein FlgI [Halanaerobiales bacterium]